MGPASRAPRPLQAPDHPRLNPRADPSGQHSPAGSPPPTKSGQQGRGHALGPSQKDWPGTELCLALRVLRAPGDSGISVPPCTVASGEAGALPPLISRVRSGT